MRINEKKMVGSDLTVIICAYNAEKYIEKTLIGFENQTLKDYHLFIIDDCSKDNTAKIVKSFINKRNIKNWSIITLEKNIGLAGSRKVGEKVVHTDYVLDFDADDIPLPGMLEKLIYHLRADRLCMGVGCYCDYIDYNENNIGTGFYIGPTSKKEFHILASHKKLIFLHHPMYRRVDSQYAGGRSINGFPEGEIRYQDMCEDLDLWCRMSDLYIQGKYFIVIPESLFLYRKHSNAMSNNSTVMNSRMRHIKQNIIRRRSGLKEINFNEYLNNISLIQKQLNYLQDMSTQCYKSAGYFYLNQKFIKFIIYLIIAFFLSPKYVLKKILVNYKHSSNTEILK